MHNHPTSKNAFLVLYFEYIQTFNPNVRYKFCCIAILKLPHNGKSSKRQVLLVAKLP